MHTQTSKPPSPWPLRTTLPPWLLAVIALTSVAFIVFPQIDLAVSKLFVDDDGKFPIDHHYLFDAFSRAITWVGRLIGIALTVAFTVAVLGRQRTTLTKWFGERKRVFAFLLASLLIGPGLIVNYGLKAFSGRARPADVTEFGGARTFTPAFVLADQCQHNCSFLSGDVAAATFLVAGFFVARSRRARRAWLVGGLSCGALVGLARIVSGHHFLSDVVIAAALTYVVLALCAAWLLRPHESKQSKA